MSGSGKSYWSRRLQEAGFTRICCDDLIEKKLHRELKALSYNGLAGVASWMGQPFENSYLERSSRYLECEKEVMLEIVANLNKYSDNDNVVVDTTGSVIYTGSVILHSLQELTKVIYLEFPLYTEKEALRLYFKDPKPIIWGNMFHRKKDETNNQALRRCYPLLMSFRNKQYKRLADFSINNAFLRDPHFSLKMFVEAILNFRSKLNLLRQK